jgi:DNA-binding transcriptional ArsR family regulator
MSENDYMCSSVVIHKDIVDKALKEVSDDSTLYSMAEFLKVFGDSTRLKIINALMVSEMCVCDISAVTKMNSSAISHHLKILRDARVVKYRRQGKVVYYSICDEHIELIFKQGLTHIKESANK